MGIFNTINQKSGLIATIIVVAVALFIVQDLFGPNSFLFNNNNVGEIAGQDISYQEYSKTVEMAKENYGRRAGKNPGDNEMSEIYNQAWSELIFKYAYANEIKELGISVPEEEVEEMISGKNLHETILKTPFFQDSLTGQFSREKYNQWKMKNASVLDNFKTELFKERERIKYMNLFQKSIYVTKEEARKEYLAQNTKAEVKYLYVPFYSIPDDSFKVSDSEVEDYISRHEKQYKMEDRRSVEYVTFSAGASPKDTMQVKDELTQLAKEFASAEDDSLFAMGNSDEPTPPSVMGLGQLPESLKARVDNLNKGEVYGPYSEGGRLKLYKVLDIIEDPKDSVYYASTKHILFMTKDKSQAEKDSIKRKAEQVLDELKKGADFDQMVRTYSEDQGSKSKGGEYKWFPKGQMVKPFEQAVFGASGKGLVGKLVETEYGYHILKVTDTKSNKKFKVATIDKEISATEGKELAYQKAANFAGGIKDTASFRAAAKKDSLSIQKAKNFKANDTYVGSLMSPRELVRWAFNTASEGDVSPVYTIGDQYVVAILTRKKGKGTAEAEDSRDEVKPKVIAEKKAAQIIDKLKSLQGDIEKKAQAYGTAAAVGVANDVNLASGTIQGIGSDPAIAGTVFGLVPGKRTVPFKGENGVAILELVKITEAPAVADYTSYKNTAVKQKEGAIMGDVDKAIREAADIKDERVKFF